MIAFLVGSLATWRLASILASERGPFAVGEWVRGHFGVHHTASGKPDFEPNGEVKLSAVTDSPEHDEFLHEIAQGLTCLYCCSVWVGLFVALLHRPLPGFRGWLLSALAMSAAAIGFERLKDSAI